MLKKRRLVQKNKKYYFVTLYGIHIETINQLHYKHLGVNSITFFSPEFEQLIEEVPSLGLVMKTELNTFKHFNGHEISLLFYSEKEENINDFYSFLMMLRPSKINRWLTFETYYLDGDASDKGKLDTSGFSIWQTIFVLQDEIKTEDIFYLASKEIPFVNKLLKKYKTLKTNSTYTHFLTLYERAYFEKVDFFKYLLLFMTIESFISDDDKTGVTYKIKRFCSVFASSNPAECQMLFTKVGEAYSVRSLLVHTAKNKLSEARYLQFLHSLVCELGIFILIAKLDKNTIFKISTSLGFGQRNSLLDEKEFKTYSTMVKNWMNFHLLDKPKKKK